jgi:hypothetical protein
MKYDDARSLETVPPNIVERDYGCGDQLKDPKPGETVRCFDRGKKDFLHRRQIVRARGLFIGVEMNDTMRALARNYQSEVARGSGRMSRIWVGGGPRRSSQK